MEIVTARLAPIVAAASHRGTHPFLRGTAWIWNWGTGEPLSEFATVFDGMGRHALSPDGEFYVAANWRKGSAGGVACYSARTGERVWHQTDLRQVQGIRFSPKGDKVWCYVEQRPVHCLDSVTGLVLAELRGVNEIVESAYSSGLTLQRRSSAFALVTNGAAREIPRVSFAMSDAVFSRDALCLAEYSGPVRCFDCETGEERWRYLPPRGCHVITLSYQDDDAFYGYLFGAAFPEAALLRFSPESGTCMEICRYSLLERSGGQFGQAVFVAGNGDILSLLDGRIVRRLAFSMRED